MTPNTPLKHLLLDCDMNNQNECNFVAHNNYLLAEYSEIREHRPGIARRVKLLKYLDAKPKDDQN